MQSDILKGTIEKIIFQNDENGFVIGILQVPKATAVTIKGYLPNVQVGQEVKLNGHWIFNPKFGKQFDVTECISSFPNTIVGLKKYLGSGLIKGIGPSFAEKLVSYFGTDILEIIDKTPERLMEVDGIGPKKVEMISAAWQDQKGISELMVFLQEKGVTPGLATKIYKKYKQESIAKLLENPYKLAEDIWGVGFKTADDLAQKIGFAYDSPSRIAAGVLHVISLATQNGHLYVELEDLKEKTITLLGLEAQEHASLLKNALIKLHTAEKIKYITKEEKHYITLSQFYYSEKGVSQKIKNLAVPSTFEFDIDEIYKQLRVAQNKEVELNEDQQRGIISCLKNKITIITGGPGTGKTTTIKKLLNILEQNNITYKLAAPTGRAAKRILEGTGRYAATIHRLLEFDVSTMSFTYNEQNALKLDFLIIDESSMLDIFLAHSILKALPSKAHIVFIGDIDQLPSVGAGNFLGDLIKSKKVACVRLTQIFRQAQDSLIVVNAHRINQGQFPVTHQPNSRHDFIFIKEDEPENVINHLKKILFIDLPKYGISKDDTMILTPMNRGIVGTQALNHQLQELLNPEMHQYTTYAGTKLKVNDKVMQIRNNYDKEVYNGDIGIIESVDQESKEIRVSFDNKVVTYESDELNEIVLAYSISIHKSQGSEYAAIIVPIFMQHFMLLQRNLIYTALTRAKKLCIFIGQTKAVGVALRNNKGTQRLTFLEKFLLSEIE